MSRKGLLTLTSFFVVCVILFFPLKNELKKSLGAYFYAYTLVVMDKTRAELSSSDGTNYSNRVGHILDFPNADFDAVVRPNLDTLYSIIWFDVTHEPLIIEVPDMGDRYYMMPVLDMWTNVIGSVGTRTTGNDHVRFAILGPNWDGVLDDDIHVVQSTTNYGWMIGRIFSSGGDDVAQVNDLQLQIQTAPLSMYLDGEVLPVLPRDSAFNGKGGESPSDLVHHLATSSFYDEFSRAMSTTHAYSYDSSVIDYFIGLGMLGERYNDFESLSVLSRARLSLGAWIARNILNNPPSLEPISGWSLPIEGMGNYGDNYAMRAVVTKIGLGANEAVDAIYSSAQSDSEGERLDGKQHYVLHFDADQLPPVKGFWSVTIYNEFGLFSRTESDRYALNDQSPIVYNADGSLDLYFGPTPRSDDLKNNWIETNPEHFNVLMRYYWPEEQLLDGRWTPPPITKLD